MYDKFFHDPHHHAKEVHHRTLGIADESFELEMHEEHKVSVSLSLTVSAIDLLQASSSSLKTQTGQKSPRVITTNTNM